MSYFKTVLKYLVSLCIQTAIKGHGLCYNNSMKTHFVFLKVSFNPRFIQHSFVVNSLFNMRHRVFLLGWMLALALLLLTTDVQAAGGSGGGSSGGSRGMGSFQDRAKSREASRWTLQEWLEQKNKIYLMDLWLSMHAPSPYEFSLLFGYNSYEWSQSLLDTGTGITTDTSNGKNNFISYVGQLQAFAQFIGVGVEHENNTSEKYSDLTGLFHIRLLGNSIQNSNLTISGGQRTRQIFSGNSLGLNGGSQGLLAGTGVADTWRQTFGQVSLSLHVTKQFGFQVKYRGYQSFTDSQLREISGNKTEAGAFIDFYSVRIFGQWFKDNTIYKSTPNTASQGNGNQEITETRTGIQSGLEFFF